MITRSFKDANSTRLSPAKAAICARIQQVRIQALLKRKKIAQPNRNRSELRVHRVHGSDMGSGGCLRGLWLNRNVGTRASRGRRSPVSETGGPTFYVKLTQIGRSHSNPTSWNERIRAQEEDAQKSVGS